MVVTGSNSTVSGGTFNTAIGRGSVVVGGGQNIAAGYYATILGGLDNSAAESISLAAGRNARALHKNSAVFAFHTLSGTVCPSKVRLQKWIVPSLLLRVIVLFLLVAAVAVAVAVAVVVDDC